MSQEIEKSQPALPAVLVFFVALMAWAVPGAGHLLLRKWRRAVVFFAGVSALALLGLSLRGFVFTSKPVDAFELLGFLSNLGAGGYYYIAKYVANATTDISRAAGDFGTRFFAAAGVLNLLCVLDAVNIASGRKE